MTRVTRLAWLVHPLTVLLLTLAALALVALAVQLGWHVPPALDLFFSED